MSDYPPEWNLVPIREIITESRINPELDDPSKRVSVRLHCEGVEKRSERATDQSGATRYYKRLAGQFIYGKQNLHKGAVGIVPKELHGFCSSQDIPAFDITPSVDPNWFLYLFKQRNFYESLESIATGTGSKRIQPSELGEKEIAVPPLAEQKKIAEILSGIDKSIRSLRLKKEKVSLAKSATSLHIFKSPKDSEQTAIQVSELQSLASIPISYGVLVPDNATRDEGVPMIKIQDINQGKIQTEKLSYISRTLHNKYAKTEVKTGDLLISLIGSIGITARVPDALQGANVSRQFAVIRTSNSGMSDYLYCFLGGAAAQERISFLSQGNAQKALNLDSLRSLEVPLKSNAEMDKVVRICQALDLTIESVSKQIDKAEKIRVSVASDLLSGRKRVSV